MVMKVLIIDVSGKGGIAKGGASRVAGNLFYELRSRGIKTYYLGYRSEYIGKCSNAFLLKGGSAQRTARELLNKAKLNKIISESRAGRIAYYSAYSLTGVVLSNAGSWLSQIKPDVVIANSIQDFIVLKRLKPYLGGAKIIYVEHANASGDYPSAFNYNILGLTFGTGRYVGLEAARKRFFKFFDGIVALNMEQFRNVKRYNRNVTVIHSSMLIADKRVDGTRLDKLRRFLGMGDSDRVVLYLGRLSEAQKNVGALILAFKGIEDEKLKLLIVGEGKSKELYDAMSKGDNRITITGRVREDMLAYYYSLADLYVLPSIWESFNATFIEAAYFGAALLLSEKSINEDIVERFGKRLYTFEPSDVNELQKKIEKYFADATLRKKLKGLSKEIAQEYSKKRQMDSYAAALKKLHEKGKF
jgi:glycosyltransferase involved in cell wall biosynthesis